MVTWRHNAKTIGGLSEAGQWFASWFMAVASRTAGFNNDYSQVTDAGNVIDLYIDVYWRRLNVHRWRYQNRHLCGYLASTRAYLRQHPQVTIFHRAISDHLVKIVCGDEHLDFDDCFSGVYFNHI